MARSYKVGVRTGGDTPDAPWGTNALRFKTAEEAEAYALDLAVRWTAVREITVLESDDEPNRPTIAP
jgi:hypothetical protein